MYNKTSKIVILGLFLFFPAISQTPITDANWVDMPGTNREVFALAVDKDGNLYAGGKFDTAGVVRMNNIPIDTAGNVRANHIAKWNGSAWSALGTGTNGNINALAVDSSGNLYTGGTFDTAGGMRVNHIAKWDGSAWSALGTGTNGIVNALAFDHAGNLYVGGNFDTTGGIAANCMACWNGSSWKSLSNGYGLSRYDYIISIAVDDSNKIYACNGGCIFRWAGDKWDTIGIVGMSSYIYTLFVDKSNNLYIGGGRLYGSPTYIGSKYKGTTFECIAKFNGSLWSEVGKNSWSGWPNGSNAFAHVTALDIDRLGNLYAGGDFFMAESVYAQSIVRYDGSSWSALGSGLAGNATPLPPVNVHAIIADNSDNLYVGGMFNKAGAIPVSNIARCVLNDVSVNSSLRNANKTAESPKIVSNKLFFSLSKPSITQFKVFDCSGRVILQSGITMLGSGKHTLELSHLSPGVYLLYLRAGDQSIKIKFNMMK